LDREYTAPAAKHMEGGDNEEYAALAATLKRTTRHNVVYEKEPPASRYIIPTPIYKRTRSPSTSRNRALGESHTGPSTTLDPDFLGQVDPAFLAP